MTMRKSALAETFGAILLASVAVNLVWSERSQAHMPACPGGDASSITNWRADIVQRLLTDSYSTSPVADRIDQCFPNNSIPACLQRARSYAGRNNTADQGSQDTQAPADQRRMPPQEFLATPPGVTPYVFKTNLEEIARQKGWPVARYKSRHSGGFEPNTPSLIMIRIPGDKCTPPVNYDRYLNFAVPKDTGADELNPVPQGNIPGPAEYAAEANGGPQMPRTFTLVTIERPSSPNGQSKVYFQRNYRYGDGTQGFTPMRASTVATECVSCHPSGLRAISPLGYHVRPGERQMPPDAWNAVKEMNDSMEANMGGSASDWRGANDPNSGKYKPFYDPNGAGPVVGPVEPLTRQTVNGQVVYPTRTQDFIMGGNGQQGCYNSRTTIDITDIFGRAPGRNNVYTLTNDPPINWQKVKKAMNCAACHDNSTRGALTQDTSQAEIDFKILVDQSMPKGYHKNPLDQGGDPNTAVADKLNVNERIALANCLQAEFAQERGKTREWLSEETCTGAPGAVGAPNPCPPGSGGTPTVPIPAVPNTQ